MEDIFKPLSLTIKELFGNQDSLYQIPRYQRPYSWGTEQLEQLWDDLVEAQENDPNYFLGSIITAQPEEESNYLDIVDGQQRLTTILILLCVCRDLYPEINSKILDKNPFAIDNNIIKGSIKYNDRFERLRLRTHSNHESYFDDCILKEGNSITNTYPLKKELAQNENPIFKFKNTAAFFTEKLLSLGEEQTGFFINYLFNKVKIIRIDCKSVSFAIKLFQVLNARGLDLSNSDLIKSFLIGKIHSKYNDDNEIKKYKEDQFIDDWKACEIIAQDTKETLNNLFVMYEYYLLAKNPINSLYEELTKIFKDGDANQIISDFKNFICTYKEKIYNQHTPIISSLYYLRWTMYWKSIVVTALYSNYPEYEKLLFLIRRYFYINWIAGYTLTKVKQTSFNLIGWIKDKKTIDEIEGQLNKQLYPETLKWAKENLKGDIYFETWCKPLLFMIEYNQHDQSKPLYMWDRSIHIEHIIPQSYRKWTNVEKVKNITEWIHSGANLTLLSGSKNISATNDIFSEKIKAYTGTGKYEQTDDKITSFLITQKIVNDFNEGKFDKDWTPTAMKNRWEWFCKQVEMILYIDLSDIKDKIIIF